MIMVKQQRIEFELPKLAIITCLNRIGNAEKIEASFVQYLARYFNVNWYTTFGKEHSIGACWQAMAEEAIEDECPYCIIMDDDNLAHPTMMMLDIKLKNILGDGVKEIAVMRQVLADESDRPETRDRLMKLNHIDAAQFVFNPKIVKNYPFPDTNAGPDGVWAELLMAGGFATINLETKCYYNALR